MIEFSDFEKVEMRVGTVIHASPNEKARKPAYVLRIDFGAYGVKTSSAQLTGHYTPDGLIGKQVIAVMNFAPRLIAGVKSEVLVLAAVSEADGTVLLHPTFAVQNGVRIS